MYHIYGLWDIFKYLLENKLQLFCRCIIQKLRHLKGRPRAPLCHLSSGWGDIIYAQPLNPDQTCKNSKNIYIIPLCLVSYIEKLTKLECIVNKTTSYTIKKVIKHSKRHFFSFTVLIIKCNRQ